MKIEITSRYQNIEQKEFVKFIRKYMKTRNIKPGLDFHVLVADIMEKNPEYFTDELCAALDEALGFVKIVKLA